MADTKGSALTPFTPVSTDYLVAVDGIGGTPATGVVTFAALDTYMEASLSLDAARITAGTFTNARVAETNVTQHQSALTILESQISDLGSYETASSTATFTNKTFDANGTGNSITNIDLADLSATGTPSISTYLRGDNTWATIAGGGDVSKVGTPADNQVGVWTGDGTIEGNSNFGYDGTTVNIAQGVKFTERADHASTPAATFGEVWLKNDAPNVLMFTDDAGTDHQVAMVTPGSSSQLATKFSTDTKTTPLDDDYTMQVDPDNVTDAQKETGTTNLNYWTNYTKVKADAVYEPIDADILKADTGDTLTAGYLSDSYSGGTISTGTYTPAPATGQENFQHITANGAFTLAPPASPCTVVLEITNGASAGTITTSGFTVVDGDSFTTTNGDDFMCFITKTNGFSYLSVKALQ